MHPLCRLGDTIPKKCDGYLKKCEDISAFCFYSSFCFLLLT